MPSSHTPGWRRCRTLSYAALATAASLAMATSSAEADFTLGPCQGAGIQARGASFQASAQSGFNQNFHSPGFCDATGPPTAYDPAGSGAGRRALGERTGSNTTGARDPAIRLGASDEPPSPVGKSQMEQGLDGTGDEGALHVIPVANGGVAVFVNFPNGCTIPGGPGGHEFKPDGANDTTQQTVRFETTNALWEAAWAGAPEADTWGELLPGISGAGCSSIPVKRVVRLDSSGTTFAFKEWLKVVNTSRTWEEPTLGNTAWPDEAGHPVIRGAANGNGPLADAVNATDGSIGYGDISTARTKGFNMTPSSADDTFWVPLRNGSNILVDPTTDPLSYKNGVTGANCTQTAFRNVPASTTGDWSRVSGVGANAGYPVCTLTYDLAFDDHATVYGNTAAEQAKARTVKDFLSSIVDNAGQATLSARDYAPLPASLLTIARGGVAAIGWNKAGGGGGIPPGGGGGGGVVTPPPIGGGSTSTPPPPVATASMSIASATVARNGTVTLACRVSGPGTLSGTETASVSAKDFKSAKNKRLTVAKVSLRVSSAGTYKLVFKLSAKAKRILAKRRKLKVSIKVTFTPVSGNPVTRTVTLTIKAKKKK